MYVQSRLLIITCNILISYAFKVFLENVGNSCVFQGGNIMTKKDFENEHRKRNSHSFLLMKVSLKIQVEKKQSQFSSGQSLSHVWFFVTPWTAAHQASLSITNCRSLLKLKSIESVMPSHHLILCWPLLLPPSIFPSIRVFSSESVLCNNWSKYWSFSFNISPSNDYQGLISFRMDWLNLLAVQGTLKSLLQTTVQKHQFFHAQFSL